MYAVRLTPRCYVIPPAGSGSGWSPAQAHCPAIDHAHQQDPMATIIKPFELPSQDYEDFDPSAVLALGCAGLSMVLQQNLLAWLSLFFSVTTIVNSSNRIGRPSSMSPLQGLMFSVLALTTIYTKRLVDPTIVL